LHASAEQANPEAAEMPKNKPFTLYGRSGSGSLAVQVALEEIGAAYDCVWVGQEPGEIARYKEVNPTGKVPALALPDGTLMFESAAILVHLALMNPQAKLAPQPGTTRHATFLQWMMFLSANVYEAVLRIYYSDRYSARGEADAAVIRDRGMADYRTHMELIARGLNPYVLGADYSIADAYLYMLTSWYPDKQELSTRLPVLSAHSDLVHARPAVAKVEADHAAHA
jgi:glutathione S-transferase